MAKKDKAIESNMVYPIKVRLIKPNPANQDKVVFNNIELFTYKDTEIADVETLMKIQPMQKYLVIKSELKESKSEVKEESVEIEDFINKYKTELNESKKITKEDVGDMLFVIEDTLKTEKEIDIDTKEDILERQKRIKNCWMLGIIL